jgi:predicted DNA-binding ribbon-helix-helix protein
MAYESKKTEQKPHESTLAELRERDALALAQLIYDIYQEKKRKENNNDLPSNI